MIRNTMETRKFDAEIGKVLKLMIHSLYTNKDIFLRELISNASDACDKLRYKALHTPELKQDDEDFKITIQVEGNKLVIADNGIGMNKEDMIENLGTIARSGTQSFIEALQDDPQAASNLIGQFGVGFYSAFMVANRVTVTSKKAGDLKAYLWTSTGEGEYEIAEAEFAGQHGTRIELEIRDQDVEYLDNYRLKHIIGVYSDHISFPIEFIDSEGKAEQINTSSALWARSKSDITDQQYEEFYHHVAHMPGQPWMTIHNNVEGMLEYKSLLFIPETKPFDLFHPDRSTRVKLYVRKVFITEEGAQVIPSYLRFLRGVVDSEDLPLNVSRETLQNNNTITKIRKSIVKKVLTSLKKRAEEQPQEFAKFWSNFGEVIKEGLCEPGIEEKEYLLEVCRFRSTKSGDGYVSFAEYIDNMQEGQEQIYFLNGENAEAIANDPQLEGFKSRDVEVLLLTDHVDDFWVNVVNRYKHYDIKAVTDNNIDLNKIKPLADNEAEESASPEEKQSQADNLKSFVKGLLGDKVKEVKISTKLVDSPACLSVPEGGMQIRMEKFLIQQKQLGRKAAKILEINPNHPIFKKVANDMEAPSPRTKQLVNVVYDQACLLAGDDIPDPFAFAKNVNELIS
jgi:molecular chaperone HtpG